MSRTRLEDLVERVRLGLASIASDDLGALVGVHDAAAEAAGLAEGLGLAEAAAGLRGVARRLIAVVTRDAGDPEGSIGEARRIAGGLRLEAGEPAAMDVVDLEILRAWVSGVGGVCEDLAALAVGMGDDGSPVESAGALARGLHTLKGECGVLGLTTAQGLCHRVEDAIGRATQARRGFPVDLVLATLDWLKAYAEGLKGDSHATPPDAAGVEALLARAMETPPAAPAEARAGAGPAADGPVDLTIDGEAKDNAAQFVSELKEHAAAAEQLLLGVEDGSPASKDTVDALFRAFHTVKGVAGFLNLRPVVELAHATEAVLDEARTGRASITGPAVDLLLRAVDVLGQILTAVGGSAPAPSRAALDEVVSLLPSIASGKVEVATSASAPVAAAAAAATPGRAVAGRASDAVVKVSTARMDGLIDLVGELVIAHQMVAQDPNVASVTDQRTLRNLAHCGKIVRDLQAVSMALRMVTVKGTFQKMARLVRDVAGKTGRRVELRTEGEDTELDRTIVDQLNDPLVHVIRNACDHGIEPEAERLAAGKPAAGTVTLRASHRGGAIVVEVEDDGRGLRRDKILRKAKERGLLAPDRDESSMSDGEVFELIFVPGFSTADKVTDISGRGVGMDVVKRSIETLRGKVEISSRAGAGTVISMRLPLTMAIIDGMVVRVGSQRFVLPTLSIESSFRPLPGDVVSVQGGRGEAVRVRGDLLPVYRLKSVLSVADGCTSLDEGLLVAVEAGSDRCCLHVDEILGQQQVVIKGLGEGLPKIRGASGGAILGDGRVALILDVPALAELAASTSERRAAA